MAETFKHPCIGVVDPLCSEGYSTFESNRGEDMKEKEDKNVKDMDVAPGMPVVEETEVSLSDGSLVESPAVAVAAASKGWVDICKKDEDEEMVSVRTGGSSVMEFEDDIEEDHAVLVDYQNHKISRKFDLQLLQQSIDDGAAVLEGIQYKDVVLVVGKTGTGKSTLIQALAGNILFATEFETTSFGQTISKTVFDSQTPIPGFEIGHRKSSQTRHINSFTTSVARKDGSTKELVYLDSPGFEDTEGSEVDIATAVMLSQVAKVARSLRFVIMINYVSLLEDRGGSMRGILKLVRSFVSDFEASKRSFMFLFTHTDDIDGICGEPLNIVKQALFREILMMCDSTKDKDILRVLSFIRLSLHRGYGFVDVFHPLKSDLIILKTNIKKLTTAPGEHLARNCGLTPTSKFKLAGEMSTLLQGLRSVLREDFWDIIQAKGLVATCRTLEQYIDIDCVHEMARDVDDVLDKFMDLHKKRLRLKMERGTSGHHAFGDANIEMIRQSASVLKAFEEILPMKVCFGAIFRTVEQELESFGKSLARQSRCSLEGLHHGLAALSAWSKGFSEFLPIYEKTKSSVSASMDVATSHVESFFMSKLESAEEDQLRSFVQNLRFLETVATSYKYLKEHFKLDEIVRVHQSAIDGITSEMLAWEQAHDEIKTTCEVETLVTRARVIDSLYHLMITGHVRRGLAEQCGLVRRSLADAASSYMQTACAQMKLIPYTAPDEVQKHFANLSELHQKYQSVPNAVWNESLSFFRSAVDHWKALLKSKSGEMEEAVNTISKEGFKNGQRDSNLLSQFQSYQFFDLFLQARERFVRNCCTAFTFSIRERAKKVTFEVDQCIALIESSTHCCPYVELRHLQVLLEEEAELSFFDTVGGSSR